MNNLNNKGFTLVEVLAVVVILGILSAITIPTVSTIISKNQEDNLKNLEKTIKSAAKMYISDNRYNILLTSDACDANNERDIDKIDTNDLNPNSKLPIKILVDTGYIKGKIEHPSTKKLMKTDACFVTIKYNCNTKDYNYTFDISNEDCW